MKFSIIDDIAVAETRATTEEIKKMDAAFFASRVAEFEALNGPVETTPILCRKEQLSEPLRVSKEKVEKVKTTRERKPRPMTDKCERAVLRIGLYPDATTDEHMDALGVSRSVVLSAAKHLGVTLKHRAKGAMPRPSFDRAMLLVANNPGLTVTQLAQKSRISHVVIRQAIKATGYKIAEKLTAVESRILALKTDGKTLEDIRRAAFCSRVTARRACLKHKLNYIEDEPTEGKQNDRRIGTY